MCAPPHTHTYTSVTNSSSKWLFSCQQEKGRVEKTVTLLVSCVHQHGFSCVTTRGQFFLGLLYWGQFFLRGHLMNWGQLFLLGHLLNWGQFLCWGHLVRVVLIKTLFLTSFQMKTSKLYCGNLSAGPCSLLDDHPPGLPATIARFWGLLCVCCLQTNNSISEFIIQQCYTSFTQHLKPSRNGELELDFVDSKLWLDYACSVLVTSNTQCSLTILKEVQDISNHACNKF